MARENGYLTSNRRIRYPFADDVTLRPFDTSDSSSPVVWSDACTSTVLGCFVDALVQVKSAYVPSTPHVTGISLSGHTLSFTLAGSPSDSPVSLTCTRATDLFPVIRGECSWCWYAFVLSSAGIRECEDMGLQDMDISGNALALSTRCVGKSAPGVTSVMVYGGEQGEGGSRYTRAEALLRDPDVVVAGDVLFKAGYNMLFSEEDGGLALSASPGAGAGVAPCGCEGESTFKTPGLLTKDGHVRLFNDTCYDLVPARYGNEGELAIHVKCKSCCTCDMYASIVNDRLIPLRDAIVADRTSINATLDTYETNVKKWNERIATALPEDIVVTSTGIPLDAAATDIRYASDVSGKMSRCGFSVIMRNDSFVDVRFDLDAFSSNGQPFEAQVSYMKTSSQPVVLPVELFNDDFSSGSNGSSSAAAPIFSIVLAPGRSATLTYFVRLNNMVKTDRNTGFIAKLKLSAYQGSRLIVSRYERMGI